MLTPAPLQEPSNEDIDSWLRYMSGYANIPMRRMALNHWQLDMLDNDSNSFTVNIYNREWIIYSIALIPDVDGPDRIIFLEYLLTLCGQLNNVKLGLATDIIFLSKEDLKVGFDANILSQSLNFVRDVHKAIISLIFEQMEDLNVHFKHSE